MPFKKKKNSDLPFHGKAKEKNGCSHFSLFSHITKSFVLSSKQDLNYAFKIVYLWDRKDASIVKTIYCSHRRPEASSSLVGWLTAAYNSSPRCSNTLFWPPLTSTFYHTRTHKHTHQLYTHTHTHNF